MQKIKSVRLQVVAVAHFCVIGVANVLRAAQLICTYLHPICTQLALLFARAFLKSVHFVNC